MSLEQRCQLIAACPKPSRGKIESGVVFAHTDYQLVHSWQTLSQQAANALVEERRDTVVLGCGVTLSGNLDGALERAFAADTVEDEDPAAHIASIIGDGLTITVARALLRVVGERGSGTLTCSCYAIADDGRTIDLLNEDDSDLTAIQTLEMMPNQYMVLSVVNVEQRDVNSIVGLLGLLRFAQQRLTSVMEQKKEENGTNEEAFPMVLTFAYSTEDSVDDASTRDPASYVHLIDGEVTGTLGLRYLLDAIISTPQSGLIGKVDQQKIAKDLDKLGKAIGSGVSSFTSFLRRSSSKGKLLPPDTPQERKSASSSEAAQTSDGTSTPQDDGSSGTPAPINLEPTLQQKRTAQTLQSLLMSCMVVGRQQRLPLVFLYAGLPQGVSVKDSGGQQLLSQGLSACQRFLAADAKLQGIRERQVSQVKELGVTDRDMEQSATDEAAAKFEYMIVFAKPQWVTLDVLRGGGVAGAGASASIMKPLASGGKAVQQFANQPLATTTEFGGKVYGFATGFTTGVTKSVRTRLAPPTSKGKNQVGGSQSTVEKQRARELSEPPAIGERWAIDDERLQPLILEQGMSSDSNVAAVMCMLGPMIEALEQQRVTVVKQQRELAKYLNDTMLRETLREAHLRWQEEQAKAGDEKREKPLGELPDTAVKVSDSGGQTTVTDSELSKATFHCLLQCAIKVQTQSRAMQELHTRTTEAHSNLKIQIKRLRDLRDRCRDEIKVKQREVQHYATLYRQETGGDPNNAARAYRELVTANMSK
eukprot:Clim_evm23s66 gene=Clim_evmTU23s66